MTSFDWLVIVVLVLSTGFAVVRGALREIGTLAALAVAAVAVFLLLKPLQSLLGATESFFATIAVGGAILAVGFVLAYFALHMGLKQVRLEGRSRTADRVGGGVFGFLRGLVLIGLGFLAYSYYLDETRRPDSVNNAVTLPMAKGMAGLFEGFAPHQEAIEPPAKSTHNDDANAAVDGYARTDRTALAEIVTTVTTNDAPDADQAEPLSTDDPIADLLTESESE